MNAQALLADIHALEEELLCFERKYGVRSEVFFAAYAQGEEPEDDGWVLDFTEWASVYRTWLARQVEYRDEISRLQVRRPGLAGACAGMSQPFRTLEDYELFLYTHTFRLTSSGIACRRLR